MLLPLALVAACSPQLGHAPLHPATSSFILQVPDLPGAREAFGSTAVARMLADPDLHAALGVMLAEDGDDPAPRDPIDELLPVYRDLVRGGGLPPLLELADGLRTASFSMDLGGEDIVPYFRSGMTGLVASEQVALRLVLDYQDPEARERASSLLIGLLESAPPYRTELQALNLPLEEGGAWGTSSVTLWTFELDEGVEEPRWGHFERSTAMLVGGARLAISMGNLEPFDFAESLAVGATVDGAGPLFEEEREALSAARGVPLFELHSVPLAEAFFGEGAPVQLPTGMPLAHLIEAFLGPIATMPLHGGHWRMDIDPEGRFRLEGVHDAEGEPAALRLFGRAPLGPTPSELAPPDGLAAAAVSLDREALAAALTEELPATLMDGAARPDLDLSASLGTRATITMPKIGSFAAPFDLQLTIELEDRERFERGMRAVAAELGKDPELEVDIDDYKRISTLYRFMPRGGIFRQLNEMDLVLSPLSSIQPTVAVLDDRVLVTLGRPRAKSEVRRLRGLARKGESSVHGALAALPEENGDTARGHAAWPVLLGGVHDQAKAIAKVAAAGQLPFDIDAVPGSETFVRHFGPSTRRSWVADGRVRHSSTSSLSFEPLVGALGAFVLVTMDDMPEEQIIEARIVQPEPVAAAEPAAGEAVAKRTEETLAQVQVAITLYQVDHDGRAPETLAALSQAAPDRPSGYLTDGVPEDGWGRALVYEVDGTSFSLRSKGADGVDDGGEGDDLVAD